MKPRNVTKAAPVARRPGRPGPQDTERDQTRDTLLNVAEKLFSETGYAGTSFRDISAEANVNPALISYYFGSKRILYEAVFKRGGKKLTDRWCELLDKLESRPGQPPTVQELLRAFFLAQFELKSSGPSGMAFIRLQTRLHSEQEEVAFALRREVYDRLGTRFIAAFEAALPDIDKADVNWRFIFIIGAGLYMTADVDRLIDLSSGRFDSRHLDEVLERLMSFCAGGIMAPSTVLPAKKPRIEANRGAHTPPRANAAKPHFTSRRTSGTKR